MVDVAAPLRMPSAQLDAALRVSAHDGVKCDCLHGNRRMTLRPMRQLAELAVFGQTPGIAMPAVRSASVRNFIIDFLVYVNSMRRRKRHTPRHKLCE